MRSLGFLHVRDGDETDLEALLRLLELARDGFQRRLSGVKGVAGGQHAEVGLRRTQHQLLLCRVVIRFGLRYLRVGLLQGRPVIPFEQALAEREAPALRGQV